MVARKLFHIQLHPGRPDESVKYAEKCLERTKAIGRDIPSRKRRPLSEFTDADCEKVFDDPREVADLKNLRDLREGDIGLVRGGAKPVALVEVTGRHFYREHRPTKWEWYPYRLPVRLLGWYERDCKRWPDIASFKAPAPGTFQLLTGSKSQTRKALERWLAHYPNFRAVPSRRNPPDWGTDEEEEEFLEGARGYKKHLRIERNRKLVALVKSRASRSGKLICAACKFDFAQMYGERGDGFIECHHTLPLATLTRERRVRPQDIALLCSNCHRMIHRRQPWLTVRELCGLILDERRGRRGVLRTAA